jgi:hypothetical protein
MLTAEQTLQTQPYGGLGDNNMYPALSKSVPRWWTNEHGMEAQQLYRAQEIEVFDVARPARSRNVACPRASVVSFACRRPTTFCQQLDYGTEPPRSSHRARDEGVHVVQRGKKVEALSPRAVRATFIGSQFALLSLQTQTNCEPNRNEAAG